jgi:hypothetical protein
VPFVPGFPDPEKLHPICWIPMIRYNKKLQINKSSLCTAYLTRRLIVTEFRENKSIGVESTEK